MACICLREAVADLEAVIVGVCNYHAAIAQPQHSQGMLQEGVCARAVPVAKAEQVLREQGIPADMCLHRTSCCHHAISGTIAL